MSSRYRGRNRRLAFNSLLRGRTITAHLRGEPHDTPDDDTLGGLDDSRSRLRGQLNEDERMVYGDRLRAMQTHGIGVVVTSRGVEVRAVDEFPSGSTRCLQLVLHVVIRFICRRRMYS